MKLYRNPEYPNRWYAFAAGSGWWMFPVETNGWSKRQPARGLDPIRIREVPATMAAEAGFPVTVELVMEDELVEVG